MADTDVKLYRIRITSETVAEVVGRRALVSIPRAEVRGMRIQHGFITERPWVLAAIGLCAAAVGIGGVGYTALTLLGLTYSEFLRIRPTATI